ncbi:hypothetical protein V3C99_004742, partial [Haemonchus contortus]
KKASPYALSTTSSTLAKQTYANTEGRNRARVSATRTTYCTSKHTERGEEGSTKKIKTSTSTLARNSFLCLQNRYASRRKRQFKHCSLHYKEGEQS